MNENDTGLIPLPDSLLTSRELDEDDLMLGERVYAIERINISDIYPSTQRFFHSSEKFSSLQALKISSKDLNLNHVKLLKYIESSLDTLNSVSYTQVEDIINQPLVFLLSELSSHTVVIYEAFDPSEYNLIFHTFPYWFWYDYIARIRKNANNGHNTFSWRVDKDFFDLETKQDDSSCQSPDQNIVYELSYSINDSLKEIDPDFIVKLILVDVEKYTRKESLTKFEEKGLKNIFEPDLYQWFQLWYNNRFD